LKKLIGRRNRNICVIGAITEGYSYVIENVSNDRN
jgi:hypothetical protein